MIEKTSHFKLSRHEAERVHYVIEGAEIGLITEGATVEEALQHWWEAIEAYFEDELSEEEILADFRQGMLEALSGKVRSAHEVLNEIEQDYADKS